MMNNPFKQIGNKLPYILSFVITYIALIIQILSSHFSDSKDIDLLTKLILALILLIVSLLLIGAFPRLIKKHRFLSGLYFIYYSENTKVCGLIDIRYESQDYSITLYNLKRTSASKLFDKISKTSVNKVVLDDNDKRVSLINSTDGNELSIYLKFLCGKNSAELTMLSESENSEDSNGKEIVVRSCSKKRGKLIRLSDSDLCDVCNKERNNTKFCKKCKYTSQSEKCKEGTISCKTKYSSKKLMYFLEHHFNEEIEYLSISNTLHKKYSKTQDPERTNVVALMNEQKKYKSNIDNLNKHNINIANNNNSNKAISASEKSNAQTNNSN